MRRPITAFASICLALVSVLALTTGPVSAQAAAQGCPPGQPPGRPAGTPPGNPPAETGRPQYPPGRCQLALSQSAAARGETFQATGGGFVPGERVTLSIAGISGGSVLADANGAFVSDLIVPSAAPFGATQVEARGAAQVLSADFEVLMAATAPEAGPALLPRTGAALAGIASFGTVLVALGTFAVIATRRRRSATL